MAAMFFNTLKVILAIGLTATVVGGAGVSLLALAHDSKQTEKGPSTQPAASKKNSDDKKRAEEALKKDEDQRKAEEAAALREMAELSVKRAEALRREMAELDVKRLVQERVETARVEVEARMKQFKAEKALSIF
jgi:flagellum-specific peptidoglycan hydrolase FlgJ